MQDDNYGVCSIEDLRFIAETAARAGGYKTPEERRELLTNKLLADLPGIRAKQLQEMSNRAGRKR